MAIRPRRVTVLGVAFLLVACSAQVAAPRASDNPDSTGRASPRPTIASSDVLYLRSVGGGGQRSILVIDARTGATLRTMPDGTISTDRSTLYWAEAVNGATETVVHVTEIASGRDVRTFTIDGDLKSAPFTGSFHELTGQKLSRDTEHLVLVNTPYRNERGWVTRLAVVDTSSGAIAGSTEIVSTSTHAVLAISPDGRSVFLDAYGEEGIPALRVFDVGSRRLADISGADLSRNGFRTAGVVSPDGRRMFRVDGGNLAQGTAGASAVVALDLVAGYARTIPLPVPERSSNVEWQMLWSTALTSDGSTLYVVNPAIGVVHEIDARQLAVRRSLSISVSHSDDDALVAICRLLFPIAEAKRFMIGGAVLSPDGRTLYAAGNAGITVIDTATLDSRQVISRGGYQFDVLSVSADGRRLYAVDNMSRDLFVFDSGDGGSLGAIDLNTLVHGIVRIDSAN